MLLNLLNYLLFCPKFRLFQFILFFLQTSGTSNDDNDYFGDDDDDDNSDAPAIDDQRLNEKLYNLYHGNRVAK